MELLAGTLPQRKALYKKMEMDDKGTLYVISYDLLKRDIIFYETVLFSAVILDEAQYIKNQKAADAIIGGQSGSLMNLSREELPELLS